MKFLITSCHHRRPQYSEQSVAAIASQPLASTMHYIASVDPSDKRNDVFSAIEKHKSAFKYMTVADRVCSGPNLNENTKNAFQMAIEIGGDYVIHVEDDVLLGRDALLYFTCNARHLDDSELFAVCAWRHAYGWLPGCGREMTWGEMFETRRCNAFLMWGWMTKMDNIKEIVKRWSELDPTKQTWGEWTDRVIRNGRLVMLPMISRAINIGKEEGTHRGDCLLPFWINS